MRYSTLVEASYDKQRTILDGMYQLFPVGEEQHGIQLESIGATIGGVGDAPQAIKSAMVTARDAFLEAGIIAYHRAQIPGQQGRKSHLTLLVPHYQAKEMLDKWQKDRLMKPWTGKPRRNPPKAIKASAAITNGETTGSRAFGEAMALSQKEDEPVKAIAGPDAPLPLAALAPLRRDESYALVTAARQYAGRRKAIHDKIRELKDQGISLKMDVEDAFDFTTDERLESVSLILPYLDQVERFAENALRRVEEGNSTERQLKAQIEGLRRELRRHQTEPTVVHAER